VGGPGRLAARHGHRAVAVAAAALEQAEEEVVVVAAERELVPEARRSRSGIGCGGGAFQRAVEMWCQYLLKIDQSKGALACD
jgi:hypothetical protein